MREYTEDMGLVVKLPGLQKKEIYMGPIRAAMFPLLYGGIIDFENVVEPEWTNVNFPTRKNSLIEYWRLKELTSLCSDANIATFQIPLNLRNSFNIRSIDNIIESSLVINFAAPSQKALDFYAYEFHFLTNTLNALFSPDSNCEKVYSLLCQNDEKINQAFMLKNAKNTLFDAFESTFMAGAAVSQTPIIEPGSSDSFTTEEEIRSNFKRIMQSTIPSQMTKIIHLGNVTNYALLGIYPKNQTIETPNGLELHPDMKEYIKIVNKVENWRNNSPVLCPIALPLKLEEITSINSYYNNALPYNILEEIMRNIGISGIDLVAHAISKHL